VGQSASIAVQATNHGQAVANIPVNFEAPSQRLFQNGTPFVAGFGAQVKTDSTGTARVNLLGVAPGAEQILISAGAISGGLKT